MGGALPDALQGRVADMLPHRGGDSPDALQGRVADVLRGRV